MYLLLFVIGIIIGRNLNEIYNKTYEDTRKALQRLSATQGALTAYYMVEGIYLAIERKFTHKELCTNSILCECNRRSCKPLSINTYVRKLKAVR